MKWSSPLDLPLKQTDGVLILTRNHINLLRIYISFPTKKKKEKKKKKIYARVITPKIRVLTDAELVSQTTLTAY